MEEWKQTEHPDYWVSNLGRVKSYKFGKERILKPLKTRSYFSVRFLKKGVEKTVLLHRIIAIAFIPNPLNLPCIDHINRIKTDNQLENLRWVTHSENMINKSDRTIHKNIYANKGGYEVIIRRQNKIVYDKWFKTLEEAQVNRDIWLLFQ